ncbi:MAG: DUF420 domain-containing protein [Planctomycetota bacterium]
MLEFLPAVNATLNATAFVLLVLGWRAVRRGDRDVHKRYMLSALGTSAVFLACYLVYHYSAGHTEFQHQGWPRRIYFLILATHVPLAALMVVPIGFLVWMGLTDRIDRHRRLARIVLPVWLYVSITGVVIYVMLYHLYPTP